MKILLADDSDTMRRVQRAQVKGLGIDTIIKEKLRL